MQDQSQNPAPWISAPHQPNDPLVCMEACVYIYVCGSVCQSVLQDDFPCASWDAGSKDQQKVYNDGLSSWCIPAFLSFFLGKLFNSSLDVVEFCRMSFYSCCIFWPQYFGCRVKGLSQTMSFWCKQTTWLSRTHFVGWLENFIKCFWSLLKCHSVRPFAFFFQAVWVG